MLHEVASFLRWRVKQKRYAVKGLNTVRDLPRRLSEKIAPTAPNTQLDALMADAYGQLPMQLTIPEIDLSSYAGKAQGAAFIDISPDHPELVESVVTEILGDAGTAAMINGYFDGRPWLWNVALNYSEPRDVLTDSQLWHFDYGDSRQLHFMVYFSDVGDTSGPFTFLKLAESDRVKRHPFIVERMTDEDLAERYAIDVDEKRVRVTGKRGDVYFNDPGRLMHQGARCSTTRLVMFISFTSRTPMTKGGRLAMTPEVRERIGAAYRKVQPDGPLSPLVFS